MRRSGFSTSRPICARAGFEVEIYDSTFGSREELFRILETERPATLGIYANLMTRANVLAILQRAVECGWRVVMGGPEPANYAEEYLAGGRGRGGCRGRRTGIGSDPARSPAGTGAGPLLSRRGRRHRHTPVRRDCSPTSTRSPGRIANASISTGICASGANITARDRSR